MFILLRFQSKRAKQSENDTPATVVTGENIELAINEPEKQ